MSSYVIVTDSTCDLDVALRTENNIEYLPMNYVVDENEYPADLDWKYHSCREFYDIMRNGKRIYTTQVPQETYRKAFTQWLQQDLDILYISCSSALSGSVNTANAVANQLSEEYPNRKIYCVDSLISSLGQGYLCLKAAEMRKNGNSVEEVKEYLLNNRLRVNQCGTVDSLEFLRRAGRVTASSAFFGNLFGVKPLLISDKIGQNFAIKKVKGALNARKEIAAQLASVCESPETQTLYISHADAEQTAIQLRDEIMKVLPFADCHISTIAPIVGASVGPGTVIAFCVGKEVTLEGGK